VALVCPLVFWYFHCTTFTNGDEAGYLAALDIAYSRIQSEGFSARDPLSRGIPGSHLMLGPELGLPAMFVFSGDVMVSSRVTLFFFYLLVLLYTFLNVNLICRDKVLAVFATCIIGSAPWLVRHAQIFLNEIAWIAAIAAAVYHMCRCDECQKKLHSIAGGLAIGLAICVRPIETFVTCLPLVCLLIARYSRRVTLEQWLYAIIVATAAIVLLGIRLRDSHARMTNYLVVVGGLWIFTMISCAMFRNRLGFKLWIMAAVIPALFFWIPRIQPFYVQVFSCTFGNTAKVNPGAIANATLLDLFEAFLLLFGHENFVFLALLLLALLSTRRLSVAKRLGPPGYLWMVLACLLGVALIIGSERASGCYDPRRLFAGAYLLLVFGLGWMLAQFTVPPQGDRKSLPLARVMAGGYALIAVAVMTNCYVFHGTKPYGMAFETNPETTYQDGVVRSVNSNVEKGAVVLPLGVSNYINKDHVALLARLEKSHQTWIVDNRLVEAKDVEESFHYLATYRQGEYIVADMDSDANPPSHKVYHALIRRIVDSYTQAVASNREVPGKILLIGDRRYLLTRARDAVAYTLSKVVGPNPGAATGASCRIQQEPNRR